MLSASCRLQAQPPQRMASNPSKLSVPRGWRVVPQHSENLVAGRAQSVDIRTSRIDRGEQWQRHSGGSISGGGGDGDRGGSSDESPRPSDSTGNLCWSDGQTVARCFVGSFGGRAVDGCGADDGDGREDACRHTLFELTLYRPRAPRPAPRSPSHPPGVVIEASEPTGLASSYRDFNSEANSILKQEPALTSTNTAGPAIKRLKVSLESIRGLMYRGSTWSAGALQFK